jgi:hypothetical protein
MNLTASGSSTSTGTGAVAEIIPAALTSTGASTSSGSATIATQLPTGSLTDFGVWPAALPDPAMSCVEAVSAPDSTGRTYLSATIPTAYTTAVGQLWNAAASAAVTGTFQHVAGNTPAITNVQIEPGPDTNLLPVDAADYRDHMVYAQASTTSGGVTTWDALPTRVQGQALSGQWCAQLANIGTISPYSMGALPQACTAVIAGDEYIGSVSIKIQRANTVWYGKIIWFDANFNVLTPSLSASQVHPGGGVYQQIRVRGQAPSGAVWAAIVPAVTPLAAGDGEVCYVDCHRLWSLQPSATSAPASFQYARQQNISVKANRVNYATNPSFTQDIGGWWGQGGTTGTPATWDGTVGRSAPGALKMSVPYVAGNTNYPQCGTFSQGPGGGGLAPGIAQGLTGMTYTLSAYVMPLPDMPTIRMYCVLGGGLGGIYVAGTTTAQVEPDAQGWYRLSVTVTVPQSVAGSLSLLFNISQSDWASYATTIGWWIDDVLVEASPLLGTYFDATLPSPDYVWEGTPFRSRSHYYQNFRFLQYRLSELLEDALPVGVAYQLLFAQPDS